MLQKNRAEQIATLIEISALMLDTSTFTEQELLSKARDLVGNEFPFSDGEFMDILSTVSFIEKVGMDYRMKIEEYLACFTPCIKCGKKKKG